MEFKFKSFFNVLFIYSRIGFRMKIEEKEEHWMQLKNRKKKAS